MTTLNQVDDLRMQDGGLGVHLTLDLAGAAKFGPDVEWIDDIDYQASAVFVSCIAVGGNWWPSSWTLYQVNPERASLFYDAIRRYYPVLPDGCLQPDYAGIRPKVSSPIRFCLQVVLILPACL